MEKHMDENDLRLANTTFGIANEYIKTLGDFEKGEKYLKKAEKIYQNLAGEYHPKFIGIMGAYALIYKHKEEYLKAIEAYQASMEYEKSTLTASPSKIGILLHNIAIVYLEDLEDYEAAENYFEQALDSYLIDNDPTNSNYLWFRIGYWLAKSHLPEHQDLIEAEFTELYESFEGKHNLNASRGRLLVGLAKFYHRQERLDDAIEAVNKAIPYQAAYRGEGSKEHEYTLGLLKGYEEERARQE